MQDQIIADISALIKKAASSKIGTTVTPEIRKEVARSITESYSIIYPPKRFNVTVLPQDPDKLDVITVDIQEVIE